MLEKLIICQNDYLHVPEVLHLLFSVGNAAIRYGIISWAELGMNIVAWYNQVLKSLVLCLNVEIAEDFYFVANLVPVKAK